VSRGAPGGAWGLAVARANALPPSLRSGEGGWGGNETRSLHDALPISLNSHRLRQLVNGLCRNQAGRAGVQAASAATSMAASPIAKSLGRGGGGAGRRACESA